MPRGDVESWTVVDDEGVEVEPVESFLAHLTAVERSPNTVRAYAHDLRDFFAFLGVRGVEWSAVRWEDLGGFVAWLRLPPAARDGRVVALPSAEMYGAAATVNRKLSALSSFYEFHVRHWVELGELMTAWRPGGRGGSWKPFLAHLGDRGSWRRTVALRAERRAPQVLRAEQVGAILDSCVRLRDRFLFALLAGSGLRVGEALGLRHEDISAHRAALPLVMIATAAWLQLACEISPRGRFQVNDEAWALLSDEASARWIQTNQKLARQLSLSVVNAMHRLSDTAAAGAAGSATRSLAEGVIADSGTWVIYRQKPGERPLLRDTLQLNAMQASLVTQLARGRGLWVVNGETRRVALSDHVLSDIEQGLVDTDQAMAAANRQAWA